MWQTSKNAGVIIQTYGETGALPVRLAMGTSYSPDTRQLFLKIAPQWLLFQLLLTKCTGRSAKLPLKAVAKVAFVPKAHQVGNLPYSVITIC